MGGRGDSCLWGLEWELNEMGAREITAVEKRGGDLVTQRISGRTRNGIKFLLGYLVTSKLIFHGASR